MSKTLCIFTLLAFVFLNEYIAQWLLAIHVGGFSVEAGFNEAFKYFSLGGYLFSSFFRAIPYTLLIIVVLSQTFKNDNAAKAIGWAGLVTISIYNMYGYWRAQHAYFTPEHVSSTTAMSLIFIPLYSVFFGAIACAIGYGAVWLYQRLKNYT